MGMGKDGDLIKGATKDFELARKYRDAKEYITASTLYRKATEKALKALFIAARRKQPPKNASIEYLAMKANLPQEIYGDIVEMPEESADPLQGSPLFEYDEDDQMQRFEADEYHSTLNKHVVVKRLLDYVRASANM